MAVLQVVSTQTPAGKTALAVGLAQGLAQAGSRVLLARYGSGPGAEEDAATFAEYLFATSPGRPLAQIPAVKPEEILIVENDAAAPPIDAPAVIALRSSPSEADVALAAALGDKLIGTVAFAVSPTRIEEVARDLTNGGLRPLALIPEDRRLASPSIGELRDALQARVIFVGENERDTVEDVLVAPVYADPARPHFRRFASKAVLAPFNKTDLHIAAIEAEAACLIITGGREPSPYVVDRANHGNTTVLLAPQETPQTINSLSDVWYTSRFRGMRKAEAIASHLEGRIDFSSLRRKIEA